MKKKGEAAQAPKGGDKQLVSRHSSKMSKRAANACEKAIESRVRRVGKELCKVVDD